MSTKEIILVIGIWYNGSDDEFMDYLLEKKHNMGEELIINKGTPTDFMGALLTQPIIHGTPTISELKEIHKTSKTPVCLYFTEDLPFKNIINQYLQ